MSPPTPDGTAIITGDPYLAPHAEALRRRYQNYVDTRRLIAPEGDLDAITTGHRYFGLNRGERDGRPGVWYREWAPGADYLALIGDFNGWDRGADPLERGEWGTWERFFPDAD